MSIYNCDICCYETDKKQYWYKHKKTQKHIENCLDDENDLETKYFCSLCNYQGITSNGLYQHKRTQKHKRNIEKEEKEKQPQSITNNIQNQTITNNITNNINLSININYYGQEDISVIGPKIFNELTIFSQTGNPEKALELFLNEMYINNKQNNNILKYDHIKKSVEVETEKGPMELPDDVVFKKKVEPMIYHPYPDGRKETYHFNGVEEMMEDGYGHIEKPIRGKLTKEEYENKYNTYNKKKKNKKQIENIKKNFFTDSVLNQEL